MASTLIAKNKPLKSLDAFDKPYYCGTNNSYSSAFSTATALLGFAPNRGFRAAATSLQIARVLRASSALPAASFLGHRKLFIVKKLIDHAFHSVLLRPATGPQNEQWIAR